MAENATQDTFETTTDQTTTDQGDSQEQKQDLVEFKDPKTGKAYPIPKDVQIAIGHHTELMRKSETAKMQKRLEEIQGKYNENAELASALQEELQKIKDAELTAEERAQKEIARAQKKAEENILNLQNERDQNFNLYKENKMQTEMFAALSQHELNSPNDSMKLIMSAGNAEFVQGEDGQWQTVLTFKNEDGDTVQMSPADAAKLYFTKPENEWQLRASLRSGSGTSQTQRGIDGTKGLVYSREEMKNPKIKAEFAERLKAGENVQVSL